MPIPRRSRQGQRPYLHVWCGLFLAYMRQYFQLAWGEVKYMCPVAPVPIYTAMLLEQPADFVFSLETPSAKRGHIVLEGTYSGWTRILFYCPCRAWWLDSAGILWNVAW